jgi:uncharacterized membrane protein YbhN (UPF0104 family)/tRNA A-37 threonylcarbamoyl transferase component Bud32
MAPDDAGSPPPLPDLVSAEQPVVTPSKTTLLRPWRTPKPVATEVRIIDAPETRVHRLTDFVALIGALLGIVTVLLLGAYAQGTTEGITQDISGIAAILQRLLVAPVNIFSGIVTLVVPALVIGNLALRKEPRKVLEAIGAGIFGFIAAVIAALTSSLFGAPELIEALSVTTATGETAIQMPAYIAAVAAMLTAAGRRPTSKVLSFSWNILWISLAVAAISGIVSLPAALTTVLIGRVVGLALRYALGSTADRAYGASLIEAVQRAGYEPRRLVRADPSNEYGPDELDEVSSALGRTRHGRVYALTTVEGHELIVVALDGDQHAAGLMQKLWSSIRVRGINTRAEVSLRHTAEATALVSHAARTAGVRTARVLGMSQVKDTMVLVYQRPLAARPLVELREDEVSNEVLDAIWAEVERAHSAGVSHRSLSADTILVAFDDALGTPLAWLTSWELGEVATGEFAKRVDRAQVFAMQAALVGSDRAVDAATRALGEDEVAQVAPLLQGLVLPRSTRQAIRARGKVLQDVRATILDRMPEADVDRENITRFGLRTVLMLTLGIVAAFIAITVFNTQQVVAALQSADPWHLLLGFAWVMLTFVGAGLAMMAFAPIRLPTWRVMLVQVAASYISLVAPAGVGPATLNLRMLTKRKVNTALAVATVALVQVSAVIVTIVGLVVLSLVTGSEGTLAALPSSSVLIGVGISAAVIVTGLTVPKVRQWAVARVMPTLRQTWPRLVQIMGQPWRLMLGLGGNLLLTVGYVGAFASVLNAFGQDLPLVDVAVLFLLGNAVGALVPTPGGLVAVEAALIAGLISAGIDNAVATSVVVVYRLLTYWARIPMGYFAMKFLQRKGEL